MEQIFEKFIKTGQLFIEDLPLVLSTYAEKIMKTSPTSEELNKAVELVVSGVLPINPYAINTLFIVLGFQWEEVYDKNNKLINRIKL